MHSINAVLGLNTRHKGAVPNGRLFVDLQSRGLLWYMSVKSTSVPFVILGLKKDLTIVILSPHIVFGLFACS